MKIYAIFNKYTDKFISFTDNIALLPKDNFNIKDIDLEELGITDGNFNLAQYRWDGDYKEGKLIDLFAEKKSIVTEEEIKKKYYGLFFRKYSVEETLFALLGDEWKKQEMKTFLAKLMVKKDEELKFYEKSENHIYETNDLQEHREKEIFAV